MKYTTLMAFILIAMQQSKADTAVMTLATLYFESSGAEEELLVGKDRIESTHNLGDALKHISGVQSSSFGPNTGAPVIRSLTGNRVAIFESGQSMNGMNAISGDINIPFDPLFTHSIRVNKWTDTVRNGGNAIGGSIDIDTGLISKQLEAESDRFDLVFKKGFNSANAQGIRVNFNNQKNLTTNIQFSKQDISSYKIPGASKASVCNDAVFPVTGGVNSALANACQKDSRILKQFNKAYNQYLDKHVLEDIAKNPDHFYDYYDGEESAKYTNDAISKRYVNGVQKEFINEPNPDYVVGTAKFVEKKINNDVTPNDHNKLSNSYLENQNIAIGTTYFLDQGYIGISADYKTSDYGVPGFSMENKSFQHAYDDGLPVGVKIKQNSFMLDTLFRQPLAFLDVVTMKASQRMNTSGEYLGATNANEYKFNTRTAELVFKHTPYKKLSGEWGMMRNDRDVLGSGKDRYLPNVKTETQAIFITEKLDLNKTYFDAGYRIEKVQHKIQDQSFRLARNASNVKLENRAYDLNSFFLGSGIKITDYLDFKIRYSESERAPEINELYGSNPHYSVMTQEEGNQNLKQEKTKAIELRTNVNLENSKFEFTLYQMDFENYFYLSHSGAAMGNRLPLKYWKQTDTRVNGFEVDMKHTFLLDYLGDLTLGGFADLVKNKATAPDMMRLANDGVYLPNMPSNRYGASIEWHLQDWTTRLSSIYYAQPKYLGKNVGAEVPLPAYNLVDLYINKKMSLKHANFDLFINGTNLLNEEARPQNSPLKYIAPLPGRAFQLGISIHI